jgi:hypothetical protein
VEAYQAFLQRSPESRFSDEAGAHIEKLRHKHIGTAHHIRLITGDIDGTASGAADLLSETIKSIFSEGGLTPTKEDSATLVLVPSLSKGSSFVRYGKTVNDSTFGNEYAFTIRLISKSGEVLCERIYKGEVKAKARAKRADFPAVEIQGLDIEELGPKLRAHLRDFYDRYVAPARRVRSDK